MKNYMKINGKTIEISQETADNLEKEFVPKKVYKAGQRVISLSCCEGTLCIDTHNKKAFILTDWNTVWKATLVYTDIKSQHEVTEEELAKLGPWRPIDG